LGQLVVQSVVVLLLLVTGKAVLQSGGVLPAPLYAWRMASDSE
jgi:hypothetical protein